MLVRELIDYLLVEVNSGRFTGSDKVPAELADLIRGEPAHLDPAEYLADKFNIKEGVNANE